MATFILFPLIILFTLLALVIGWGGLFLVGYAIYKWWRGEFQDLLDWLP